MSSTAQLLSSPLGVQTLLATLLRHTGEREINLFEANLVMEGLKSGRFEIRLQDTSDEDTVGDLRLWVRDTTRPDEYEDEMRELTKALDTVLRLGGVDAHERAMQNLREQWEGVLDMEDGRTA